MPHWKDKSDKSGFNNPDNFSGLLPLLESPIPEYVDSVKDAIQEILSSSKDSKLLNNLIDFYIATDSKISFEILLHVREPHDKHTFEKINDMIKNEVTRHVGLQLLGKIVYKKPSWLHKISNQRLMQTLLNILKNDIDSSNLLSGVFIMICILPLIPHQFGSLLPDTFEIFSRLVAWNIKKPSTLSEVLNMHLQTGVYSLFHRLYGMFPCNFLAYLRSFYGGRDCSKENFEVFTKVIKPMLERVKLHPLLVTASKEFELSVNRWKRMDYHDIVVDCASISLDAIEGTFESFRSIPLSVSSQTENNSSQEGSIGANFFSLNNSSVIVEPEKGGNDSLLSLQDQIWSPSQICDVSASTYSSEGLSLPPVTKGEWEYKNDIQSSMDESIPLDIAVEAKPEILKSDLDLEKYHPQDFSNDGRNGSMSSIEMKKSEIFSQNSTDSDLLVINPSKLVLSTENKEEDVDKEVCEITSTQALDQSLMSNDIREDTPFCSTTQNLTDDPDHSTEAALSLSGRYDSLTKSTDEDVDEMYNSMQEVDMGPAFTRFRYFSHCGPAPDLVTTVKKPKAFRSVSCPANFFPDTQNIHSTELSICNGEKSDKKVTTIVAGCSGVTETSAFVSLPAESSLSTQKDLPAYQKLLPVVVNPSLYFELPVVIGHQNGAIRNQKPKYLSPPELLDIYIQQGNASYLNHLPLTSRNTDWTHFGGEPPLDEINVLKTQIRLLHNTLLFERHRKDIHSERNRRILGRIKNSRMNQEFVEALKSEILILTSENDNFKRELVNQSKIFKQLLDQKKKIENELESRIFKTGQDNTQLLFSNKQLQTLLVSQKEENDEIRELYKKVQCEIANMKCQLRYASIEVQNCQKVKKESIFLTKQLILLQELNSHYKSKLDQMKPSLQPDIGSRIMNNALLAENTDLKQKLDSKSTFLDASKGKIIELENLLSDLKLKQTERTDSYERMKSCHQAEIMAREDRLKDLQKISAEKDACILKLFADIDELNGKIESLGKNICKGSQPSSYAANDGSIMKQRTDDALS